MGDLLDRVRYRVIPALVTALSVMLLTGGLLSYTDPATAGPVPSESPVTVELPSASPSPWASPPPSASPSLSPSPSAAKSAKPGGRVVATRVVVPSMRIDLPVIRGPTGYPPCNVALYLRELGQPGQPRATYLYAHARTGMFLPLLDASKVDNGAGMLGKQVQVYTSDDQLHLYEIFMVKRHQRSLDAAFAVRTDQLWLQTSEGPNSSYPKLMVVARPLDSGPASHADARPKPKPVSC